MFVLNWSENNKVFCGNSDWSLSKFPFPKGERQKGGLCEEGEYKKVEDKSKTKKEDFFSSSLYFFNDNDTKVEHIDGGGGIYKGVGA